MTAIDSALAESLTPGPSPRAVRWGLGAILTLHLVLSLWLGWPEPGPTRWWDERFNVFNLEAILKPGGFELANGYYGGVSYLPQAGLLAIGQELHQRFETPAMVNRAGHLTPTAYHLLRSTQALWGSATLLLLFLLGRRLLRPEGALLAVGLAAITPRLYHSSAIFKPDIELVAATLLALLCSWRALEGRPHYGRYLLAGAAVGLAVGAKLNGVAVAIPLTLATLWALRSGEAWRRLSALALAGGASFLTFWAFNPDLPRVLRSLEKNQAHYQRTTDSGGPLEVLIETLGYPFTENFHRPWIASLGGLGLLLVARWLWRRRSATEGQSLRLRWAVLLSYPPAYYLLYALASPRAKANHFLQVVPFVALGAAVALLTLHHVAARARRPLRSLLIALFLVLLVLPPLHGTVSWIHSQAVPSTWDLAQDWVERQLPEPSRAFRVGTIGRDRRGRFPRSPVYQRLDDRPPAESLADLDALILPRRQLTRWQQSGTAPDWLDQVPRQDFPGRLLQARDSSLVVFLQPHRRLEHPQAGRIRLHRGDDGRLTAPLPTELVDRELSLRVRLAVGDRWAPELRLELPGESLPLYLGPASGGDIFLTSPRFSGRAGDLAVRLDGKELQAEAKAELFVWAGGR